MAALRTLVRFFCDKAPGCCRLSAGDRYALTVAIGFKAALLLLGTLSFIVFQNRYPDGYGLWPYLSVWNRWDALGYIQIADHGYTAAQPQYTVFFPLFPLLVRLFRPLIFDDTLSSAFAVSTVASLFAAVGFYRLARFDLRRRAAERAVWFLFAFPTAYFIHIGYTEALFLALTFGAIIAARERRWLSAGVLGGLAAATRMNGALLLTIFVCEAIQEWRVRGSFNPKALASLLTVTGTAFYLYLNYRATGNPLAFFAYQRDHWYHHLAPPWAGIWQAIQFARGADAANAQMVGTAEAVACVLVFAVGFYALGRKPIGYGLWTLLNVVLWSSNNFIMSAPRYALIAIPLFLLMARVSKNRSVFAWLTIFCLLLQGLFAIIFAQGRWAF